jgi:hypothetical protein
MDKKHAFIAIGECALFMIDLSATIEKKERNKVEYTAAA